MSKMRTCNNKNVKLGFRLAQNIIGHEAEARDYLKAMMDLITDGHDEIKTAVDHLVENMDENAIAAIYSIVNPVKPDEIKDHEQKMLMDILATLSVLHMNEMQRRYYDNLRQHLNIGEYEPDKAYDFEKIETIESVKAIKTIAKAVRIYLFLEESGMDGIYKHEDDLFMHFEIKSFNEIDAMIEIIYYLFGVDGLIEFYGDFETLSEVDGGNFSFMDMEEKAYLEISNECAQIYFKDCYFYDKNKCYIESPSYIIFNVSNNIKCIHKSSGIEKTLLEDIEETGEYIRSGKITTYQDMAFYVIHNDLFFCDIDTMVSGKIFHIDEEKDEKGELLDVGKLTIYQGKKIIYKNGQRYYIRDFNRVRDSAHCFCIDSESDKCFIKGDHLYFIEREVGVDYSKKKGFKVGYSLKRYGILNHQETILGKLDVRNAIKALYALEAEGIYDNKYFCIWGYQGYDSPERDGFDCFYFNMDNEAAEPHFFYIWNTRVFQIEQYKNYLIYVNADKKYSLVRHDFVEDKKKVLLRNFGQTEKSSFVQRMFYGKSSFMMPLKYMRLGKWLWVRENGEITPKIISIC